MADRGQNRTLTVVPVGKLIDLDDELEEAGSLDLTAPKGAETVVAILSMNTSASEKSTIDDGTNARALVRAIRTTLSDLSISDSGCPSRAPPLPLAGTQSIPKAANQTTYQGPRGSSQDVKQSLTNNRLSGSQTPAPYSSHRQTGHHSNSTQNRPYRELSKQDIIRKLVAQHYMPSLGGLAQARSLGQDRSRPLLTPVRPTQRVQPPEQAIMPKQIVKPEQTIKPDNSIKGKGTTSLLKASSARPSHWQYTISTQRMTLSGPSISLQAPALASTSSSSANAVSLRTANTSHTALSQARAPARQTRTAAPAYKQIPRRFRPPRAWPPLPPRAIVKPTTASIPPPPATQPLSRSTGVSPETTTEAATTAAADLKQPLPSPPPISAAHTLPQQEADLLILASPLGSPPSPAVDDLGPCSEQIRNAFFTLLSTSHSFRTIIEQTIPDFNTNITPHPADLLAIAPQEPASLPNIFELLEFFEAVPAGPQLDVTEAHFTASSCPKKLSGSLTDLIGLDS